MKPASILVFALLTARVAAYSRHRLSLISNKPAPEPAPGPAPAPAPGPAPGPAAALAAVQVTFEIKNYNYYDLTKETCPETVEETKGAKGSPQKAKGEKSLPGHPGVNEAIEEMAHHADKLANSGAPLNKPPPPPWMEEDGEKAPPPSVPEPSAPEAEVEVENLEMQKPEHKPLPWMEKKENEGASSLLSTNICVIQHSSLAAIHSKSDKCQTVMDVFRSAISEVVKDVIKCVAAMPPPSAPGAMKDGTMPPAKAVLVPLPPQPQGFLQISQHAKPAAEDAAPTHPDPAVFVTFAPGTEKGSGRTVIVEVTMTDTPENGLDDVALTKGILERAIQIGLLKKELKAALAIVSGIWPKLGKTSVKTATVEGWDVKKCEGHVKSIVDQFSHHYTREQVPMAMLNECTNFMTRMSFSNDHVLDPIDTLVCKKTTVKFAQHWNYGEKAKPEDFELMCVHSCEGKYGKNAPQCHVTTGKELAGKPLL